MHAALSFLGAAMLILVGVAVVLATVILILFEACWIVRLGRRLTRAAATVDAAGRAGEGGPEEGGGA
jgi:Na+-transporting methylmalonyl-CoA/oxaloacetate decarboxylase gamma subunit